MSTSWSLHTYLEFVQYEVCARNGSTSLALSGRGLCVGTILTYTPLYHTYISNVRGDKQEAYPLTWY